jgi:hypothetical protein
MSMVHAAMASNFWAAEEDFLVQFHNMERDAAAETVTGLWRRLPRGWRARNFLSIRTDPDMRLSLKKINLPELIRPLAIPCDGDLVSMQSAFYLDRAAIAAAVSSVAVLFDN